MAHPSPLSALSGALKIADKITVAMEAVGDKILLNSQGWEVRGSSASGRGADGRGALGAALSVARAPAGEVREHRPGRPARGGLRARRLRMSDPASRCDAQHVTRDETRSRHERDLDVKHRISGKGIIDSVQCRSELEASLRADRLHDRFWPALAW